MPTKCWVRIYGMRKRGSKPFRLIALRIRALWDGIHPIGQGSTGHVNAKHTGHKSKALDRYKHLFPQLREETVQLIDSEVKIPKKKD
jgi:hypothetical protein